jgi:hypothetical protein
MIPCLVLLTLSCYTSTVKYFDISSDNESPTAQELEQQKQDMELKLKVLQQTIQQPKIEVPSGITGLCCVCLDEKENVLKFEKHPTDFMCVDCSNDIFRHKEKDKHQLALCPHGPEDWRVKFGRRYRRTCDCCEEDFEEDMWHLRCTGCPRDGFDMCKDCVRLIDGENTIADIRYSHLSDDCNCPICRGDMLKSGDQISCIERKI